MKSTVPHILYTEDNADTRELVWYVLTTNDCEVTLADCYEQALLLARSNSFDLYIVDNWMPGGSGIDLCRKLRTFDPTTPILFYSGAAYERDKQEAIASGAQGYLTKPVDNDELVAEVFKLIATRSTQHSAPRPSRDILPADERFDYKESQLRPSS